MLNGMTSVRWRKKRVKEMELKFHDMSPFVMSPFVMSPCVIFHFSKPATAVDDPDGLSVALPGGIQGTLFPFAVPEALRERLLDGRPNKERQVSQDSQKDGIVPKGRTVIVTKTQIQLTPSALSSGTDGSSRSSPIQRGG